MGVCHFPWRGTVWHGVPMRYIIPVSLNIVTLSDDEVEELYEALAVEVVKRRRSRSATAEAEVEVARSGPPPLRAAAAADDAAPPAADEFDAADPEFEAVADEFGGGVEDIEPPATTYSALQCEVPAYLRDALRARAAADGCTVTYLVLSAMASSGYVVHAADLIADGRKSRSRRERA